LLAPIIAPLLVFGVAEAVLRLGGYGYPVSFFLPETVNGRKALIQNDRVGWRFFGPALARKPYPTVLPAVKSPGTIRIFVFGESAAYGDPEPDFGLPRVMQTLLRERYPGTRFEVVNMGMVAINSNVILPFARECAGQEGDIWVIYMGNNEVVGPYGGGTVFGSQLAGIPVIRTSLALKTTRTGQLLSSLLESQGGSGRPVEWRGMSMFVRNQVRQDDPRMAGVYSNFRRNLEDILLAGVAQGAKIVVSTVAVNLRDCAPFASLHRRDLKQDQLQHWNEAYQAGVEAEKNGQPAEAVVLYQKAAQIDDQFADLQFRWARCCLVLGREEEARRRLVFSRDLDALRFRADSRINEIIRQTAQSREKEGIFCVDAEKAFAGQSPHGLPGSELLYEHVHFNFEGNYLLARILAEQVNRQLPAAILGHTDSRLEWISLEECKRMMGWTEWEQLQTLQRLRMDGPPFTSQLDHSARMANLEQQMNSLTARMSPEAWQADADQYGQLLAKVPDDWVFLRHLARLQQRLGNTVGAVRSLQEITRLLPQEGDAYLRLGLLSLEQGRQEDAIKYLEKGMELDPRNAQSGFVQLLNETGIQLVEQGNYKAAVQLYRQALDFKPDSPEVHINLGMTLLATGDTNEAREHFKAALKHPPGTSPSLIILGQTCYGQGWFPEAIASFETALKLNQDDAMVHFHLGEALAAANRSAEAQLHFAEALRLNPDMDEARSKLGR
jgi:tetratricopeptide (TPR) repeat protein